MRSGAPDHDFAEIDAAWISPLTTPEQWQDTIRTGVDLWGRSPPPLRWALFLVAILALPIIPYECNRAIHGGPATPPGNVVDRIQVDALPLDAAGEVELTALPLVPGEQYSLYLVDYEDDCSIGCIRHATRGDGEGVELFSKSGTRIPHDLSKFEYYGGSSTVHYLLATFTFTGDGNSVVLRLGDVVVRGLDDRDPEGYQFSYFIRLEDLLDDPSRWAFELRS